MKVNHLPLAVLVCSCLFLLVACQLDESHKTDRKQLASARSRFELPKLLDFEEFKQKFVKFYSSILEELVKKRIYLIRVFAAFCTSLQYKQGKLSSYLAINQMSDWTPEERAKVMLGATMADASSSSASQQQAESVKLETMGLEKMRALAHDTVDRNLNFQISSHEAAKQRARRSEQRGFRFDPMALWKAKPVAEPRNKPVVVESPAFEADELFIDHRRDNCFTPIKNQGKCGSCSIFAAVALYEYLHCKQTGSLETFSEQHLVDCMREDGYSGCLGVPIDEPVRFVNSFGLELESNYLYEARQSKCRNSMRRGSVRPKADAKRLFLNYELITERLEETPVLFSIMTNEKFLDYGGGVDDNDGCRRGHYHAMLIVGHGREDGKEYLLFRNSHSENWGQKGHYKMNIDALDTCPTDPFAVYTDAQFS